jgi:hypothetical protein
MRSACISKAASYWLEGNSRSPQEAMVTGDCGGVREHSNDDRKIGLGPNHDWSTVRTALA